MCDWLDLEVPTAWRVDLLELIASTPNLNWLLLTKRPESWNARMHEAMGAGSRLAHEWLNGTPPPNVWVGTSVENQPRADERIPELLKIPARVRFLSCEPLLSSVDLGRATPCGYYCDKSIGQHVDHQFWAQVRGDIHWVIVGGESGPKARPMHPDWARSIRDQCQHANVPFLFKQWGEWAPATEPWVTGHVMPESGVTEQGTKVSWIGYNGNVLFPSSHGLVEPIMAIARVGKKAAGRMLDGREWNEFPNL